MHSDERHAKIIKMKTENPQLTTREIGDKVGLSKSQVARIIRDKAPHQANKSTRIADIIDRDKKLVYRATKTFARFLDQIEEKDEVKTSDIKTLNSVIDSSYKRFTMLQGDVTDEEGGLRDLKSKSVEELMKLRDDLDDWD